METKVYMIELPIMLSNMIDAFLEEVRKEHPDANMSGFVTSLIVDILSQTLQGGNKKDGKDKN